MRTRKAQDGRGATANEISSRFDDRQRLDDGDWLDARNEVDGAPPRLRTEVTIEKPRRAITYNSSPDIGFDRSVNAYRGCEHGCVYCFARPTHAYLNLSPGQDFESRLFAKPDAPALLRSEIKNRSYRVAPLALGTNTDPYQPIEGRFQITRQILEVLEEHGHPVTITTKSARVCRDIDILSRMAERGLASVALSITSMDPSIASQIEPRASAPGKRIAAVRTLAGAGVPVTVGVSPIIPAITDHEIEAILGEGAAAGAKSAFWLLVRLPHEVSPIFRAWLQKQFPQRAQKVMHLIQEARGGRDNDPEFFSRFRPRGAYAEMLETRFKIACKKLGLDKQRGELRRDLFQGHADPQLSLFSGS